METGTGVGGGIDGVGAFGEEATWGGEGGVGDFCIMARRGYLPKVR